MFFFTLTKAQAGLGIGSAGLHIKTSPEKTFGLIGRLGFSLGSNSVLLPELNGIRRLINEDKAKLYLGAGLGTYLFADRSFDRIGSIFLRVPVGIEYFPFESKKVSFTAEIGLV